MPQVYLGLGSNTDACRRIGNALSALARQFGQLSLSPVYESEPVGFAGGNFLNMVVGLSTHEPVASLRRRLREIERENGRDRTRSSVERSLDIDLLAIDDWVGSFDGVLLPRPEILSRAFVLKPFSELAPDYLHPEQGCSLAALWQAQKLSDQKLWRVDFAWDGQRISSAHH